MLVGLLLIPLTIIIAIVREERPRTVLIVSLISWAISTLWQGTYTMGFDSYGALMLYIFVFPALIVVLLVCKIYAHHYNVKHSEDKPKSKRMSLCIAIWAISIIAAYVVMDREPVFDIVDRAQRVILSDEQLHELWQKQNQREWQELSNKLQSQFSGGIGTEADPFQIASARELRAIEQALTIQQPFYFVQTADITISSEDLNDRGFWNPIGNIPGYFYLKGGYDGGGYRIYGLRLEVPEPTDVVDSLESVGLFYCTADTVLKNIHIVLPEVVGDASQCNNVGYLLGCNSSTQIIVDCVAYIDKPADFGKAGGLIGRYVECAEFVNSGVVIVE